MSHRKYFLLPYLIGLVFGTVLSIQGVSAQNSTTTQPSGGHPAPVREFIEQRRAKRELKRSQRQQAKAERKAKEAAQGGIRGQINGLQSDLHSHRAHHEKAHAQYEEDKAKYHQ